VTTPPALERIIQTALEKHPDERWQTAQDVARQLRWISETSATTELVAPSRRSRFALPAAILVTALAAGLVTWGATRLVGTSRTRLQTARLHLALPDGIQYRAHPEVSTFAVSPDGSRLLFTGANDGRGPNFLFLRALDSYDARKLEGTEGALGPFWSSDGNWIGFTMRGKLWKMRSDGGTPPEEICEVHAGGARATWQGKTILFADSRGNNLQIFRVSSDGGKPASVTTVQKREWRHGWPMLFPDGKHFLYLAFGARTLDRNLVLASLDSPRQTVLTTNVSFPRLLRNERVAYVRDGKLLSQHCDLAGKGFVDEPTTVASDVNYFYPTARADFDTSPAGVVVYRTDTSSTRLFSTDRNGTETKVLEAKDEVFDQAISPDGRKAAVTILARDTGLMDIWIYDLARGVRDRFTSEPGIEVAPAFSPDGSAIVFCQGEGGTFPHLVLRSLNGATSEDITPRDSFQFSPVFSPDGEWVYFDRDSESGVDIHRVSVKTKKVEPVLSSREREFQSQPSPDGRWLAFTSNAAGSIDVYLQNLVDGSGRMRISNDGGQLAQWRADGRELFYISGSNSVMSVAPTADGRWDEASPKELFNLPEQIQQIAAFPDGKSFLISTWRPGTDDELFHVVISPE
jgi:Tol biopolymer transport system component